MTNTTARRRRSTYISRRRWAYLRFRNVWTARFRRHEEALQMLTTLVAGGAAVGILVTVLYVAKLYQQGVI